MHRTQDGAIERGRKDCRPTTLHRIVDGLQVRRSVLISEMEALAV